ncbi:hypothetical protein K437DRAFT_276075 [Tilletiaria anomala UBC 951]|uniref:LIM zinc-binding domain-containing protein n=1 Tax=Tilletiaria anomala (strain ATCC 24038 / CBS 436.72 / UBC 951) TaxID=1037660 RepID=A0A066VG24_TILAU|nr:uncharacterized protein K437DRAFT_276075 [Tilletiaria anomala UBC 951]KDN39248.1 hypothetical protein K437DRAFT_276075 [Tilletiaria anomala UBC 951]
MPPRFGIAAPKCARCDKSVYQAEQVIGPAAKPYHKSCLTCMACGKRLDSTLLLEHEGEAYCKNCHKAHLGQGKGGFATAVPLKASIPRSPPASAASGGAAYGSPSFASAAGAAVPRWAGVAEGDWVASAGNRSPTRAIASSRVSSPPKLPGRVIMDELPLSSAQDASDSMLNLADEISEIRISSREPKRESTGRYEASSYLSDGGYRDSQAVHSIDDAIASGATPKIFSRSSETTGASRSAGMAPLSPKPALPIPSKYTMPPTVAPVRTPLPELASPAPVRAQLQEPTSFPVYRAGADVDSPRLNDPFYEPSAAEVIAAVRAGRVPGSPHKAGVSSFDGSQSPLRSASPCKAQEAESVTRAIIGSVPAPPSYSSPAAASATASGPSRLIRPVTPPQQKSHSATYSPEPRASSTPSRTATGGAASGPRLPSPTRPDMKRFRDAAIKTAPMHHCDAPAPASTTPKQQQPQQVHGVSSPSATSGATTSSPSFSAGINRLGLSSSIATASAARSGTPLCARCDKPVYFAEQLQASGRKWHRGCLRCDGCNTSLDPGKLEEGPTDQVAKGCNTWCRTCYAKYFGPKGIKVGMSLPEGLPRS